MNTELVKNLSARFPCVKSENNVGLQWGVICDCGDGWYEIIFKLLEAIEGIYQKSNLSMENDFKVTHIKEKYGTLHFYVVSSISEVHDIILEYEKQSETVCEECASNTGSLHIKNEYLLTLCEKCASERGYTKERTSKMSNPKYFIIAGVNGAGKSTIYRISKDEYKDVKYVNPDVIAAQINQNNIEKANIEAGKKSVQLINECIENKKNFVQETTLSGRSTLNFMLKAKQQGYSIDMTYIGLNSPEYAIERVQNRVLNGGHSVPEKDIVRRYNGSLENLNEAIKLCDTVSIYDNSGRKYEAILKKNKGKVNLLSNQIPDWLRKVNNYSEINKACADKKELNKRLDIILQDSLNNGVPIVYADEKYTKEPGEMIKEFPDGRRIVFKRENGKEFFIKVIERLER